MRQSFAAGSNRNPIRADRFIAVARAFLMPASRYRAAMLVRSSSSAPAVTGIDTAANVATSEVTSNTSRRLKLRIEPRIERVT